MMHSSILSSMIMYMYTVGLIEWLCGCDFGFLWGIFHLLTDFCYLILSLFVICYMILYVICNVK